MEAHESKPSGLAITHLNARSLCNKFHKFKDIVLQHDYSLIGVSETWFPPDVPDDTFSLPGYNIIRKDRATVGGGVALYVKSFLKFEILKFCSDETSDSSIEYLLIKLKINSQEIAVGTFYRPHGTNFNNLNF